MQEVRGVAKDDCFQLCLICVWFGRFAFEMESMVALSGMCTYMSQAPSPPEQQGTTRGIREVRRMKVLYLFSGAQRKTSVTSVLQQLAKKQGIECEIHDVDIQNSPEWDLTKGGAQSSLLQRIKSGEFDVVLITPPCSTWSRVRGANCRGPPMIRSRQYVWGFPWLSGKHSKDAELGNVLIEFMLDVLDALEQCPVTPAGHVVLVFGEHPEDLGVAYREEDGVLMDPASIWQLPRLRKHVEDPSPLHLFTVVFNQCCWGAPYRKPTRLIANLEQLRSWGACDWPQFDAHGHYAGPVLSCQCKPTVTLARSAHDAGFRTSTTSSYPPQMDGALAQAILAQWVSTPLQAKVGPEKGGGESRAFHDPGAEVQPARGQDKKRPCGEGGAEAVREGKSQRKWSSRAA